MTSTSPTARTAAVAATVGLAAACWILVFRQASGMDMGVATTLDPFTPFLVSWAVMMAAMMLPGVAPAVLRLARESGRVPSVLAFVGSYLAVWTLFGVGVFVLYRPHGYVAAGATVIAAGVYELTPAKRFCRGCCRGSLRSGFRFALFCVGSTVGLMLMLVELGVMSVAWMAALAILITAQKILPARVTIDVPLALAIVGLGILILVAPWSIPGLTPAT